MNKHYEVVFQKFDKLFEDHIKNNTRPAFSELLSWNWASFFFGSFWFLFKGHFTVFLLSAVIIIIGLFIMVFPGIIAWIIFGLTADFVEYHKFKTGKSFPWNPIIAVNELLPIQSTGKSSSKIISIDIPEQIKKLSSLKNDGVITEFEFENKKKELLAKM